MNASTIISDDMTLDEKLAAIDAAIASAKATADAKAKKAKAAGQAVVPFDPADLTICDSCQ